MSFSNIYRYLMIFFLITTICLVVLWRYCASNLNKAQAELKDANQTIEILQNDHKNLIEYIELKEKEIKEVEKKYSERLKNIPKDKCGDAKPSKELLEYLRRGQNETNL